jgi:hypothetical protein
LKRLKLAFKILLSGGKIFFKVRNLTNVAVLNGGLLIFSFAGGFSGVRLMSVFQLIVVAPLVV